MSRALKILFPLAALLSLTTAAAFPAAKAKSISTSRQFIVYGASVAVRGAVCDLAEQTKANLLHHLKLRDDWKTPLLVNLDFPRANYPDAPGSHLEVSQLGYGLKLQLNLLVTGRRQGPEVQRELLRAILLEMMYRGRTNIPAGTPYLTPPDWLLDGLLALQPGRENEEDAALLHAIVAEQKIAPLAEVVRQKRARLDPPSQRLHHAYAHALLQLLLETPGGAGQLAHFIRDLPAAPNDELADLRAHFPATLGPAADKWWALSVARLSAADRYQTLSASETGAQLDRLLHFVLIGRDGAEREYSLGDFAAYRKLPGAAGALQRVGQRLLLLGAHAHPFYQPIAQELYRLTGLLVRGKTRRVTERLERVASYRAVVEQQSRAIDDYLNWYEATQSKTMSGQFSLLLQPEKDQTPPRRRDPISVYLDSVEMEIN